MKSINYLNHVFDDKDDGVIRLHNEPFSVLWIESPDTRLVAALAQAYHGPDSVLTSPHIHDYISTIMGKRWFEVWREAMDVDNQVR